MSDDLIRDFWNPVAWIKPLQRDFDRRPVTDPDPVRHQCPA